MDQMILAPKEILMVMIVGLLSVTVAYVWCEVIESDAESEPELEDFECPYPYIIDEQGRLRLIATVTMTLNITVGTGCEDSSENDESDSHP